METPYQDKQKGDGGRKKVGGGKEKTSRATCRETTFTEDSRSSMQRELKAVLGNKKYIPSPIFLISPFASPSCLTPMVQHWAGMCDVMA